VSLDCLEAIFGLHAEPLFAPEGIVNGAFENGAECLIQGFLHAAFRFEMKC
jgi:hypothetical protein